MPNDSSTAGEPYYGVTTAETDEPGVNKTPRTINDGLMKRTNPGQIFTNYISIDSIDEVVP